MPLFGALDESRRAGRSARRTWPFLSLFAGELKGAANAWQDLTRADPKKLSPDDCHGGGGFDYHGGDRMELDPWGPCRTMTAGINPAARLYVTA